MTDYTLPIRCSTVRKVSDGTKSIIRAEVVVIYLLSVYVAVTQYFGRPSLLVFLSLLLITVIGIGFIMAWIMIYLFEHPEIIPHFECIKDE